MHNSRFVVLEGDEYDSAFFDKRSKFLHYLPELVIVNNIEFDHADIFASLEEIKVSFRRLLDIVPENGMVLINGDDPNCVEVAEKCRAQLVEAGFSPNAARHIRDVRYDQFGSEFTLLETRFSLPLVGEYNVRNAAMAASAAHFYGVPLQAIAKAIADFK
ncbi:MAG: Mur ligase family protein, partial [Verrucomicrobiota bacterium]|nr:Mur ligase family protein [Verrucomicrobiota bacterium]